MNDASTFRYTDVSDKVSGARMLPLLPITLIRGQHRLDATGLLDSGAVVSVLPYSIGVQLGLEWEEQHIYFQLSGNLEKIPAIAVLLSVQLGEFAPVRIAFAWSKSDSVRLLLGQTNFFSIVSRKFYRDAYKKVNWKT